MKSLTSRSAPLDLLRTLAILLVFTSHFRIFAGHEWFVTVGPYGWAGVDLFFVLSGFLIASQLFREMAMGRAVPWKEFYLRRGFRIWPAYFTVLFLYVAIPAFVERGHLPPLWKFFTFTQNFGLDYRTEGAFSHAWSLCVEEQFYLLLPPVIATLCRNGSIRRSIAAFLFLIVGGMILRDRLWMHFVTNAGGEDGPVFYREIYYPTYCRLDGLAMGVAMAAVYRFKPIAWARITNFGKFMVRSG